MKNATDTPPVPTQGEMNMLMWNMLFAAICKKYGGESATITIHKDELKGLTPASLKVERPDMNTTVFSYVPDIERLQREREAKLAELAELENQLKVAESGST